MNRSLFFAALFIAARFVLVLSRLPGQQSEIRCLRICVNAAAGHDQLQCDLKTFLFPQL